MIENIGSIFEIIAALYVTLAFDKVINQFVERFDVRNKLIDAIIYNTDDSDKKLNVTKSLVNDMSNDFIKQYSRLAPLLIFLSLVFLYITSFDGVKEHCWGWDTIVLLTIVTGVIAIVIFMVSDDVLYDDVIKAIVIILVLDVVCSLVLRCYFENLWRCQNGYIPHYVITFFSVFILLIPIMFLIYRSKKHPELCTECLRANLKLKALLEPDIKQNITNDEQLGDKVELGFLPKSQNPMSIEDVKSLLKGKGLFALKKKIKELNKDCADIIKGDEARNRHRQQ